MQTNRLQMAGKKKRLLVKPLFQTYASTWFVPPGSPAKPYLKVFFICIVAEVLHKGYVYRHRNSQKTRLLSILYTGFKSISHRPVVFVVGTQHREFARFLF